MCQLEKRSRFPEKGPRYKIPKPDRITFCSCCHIACKMVYREDDTGVYWIALCRIPACPVAGVISEKKFAPMIPLIV